MSKIIDLTGKRYGRLTVLDRQPMLPGPSRSKSARWRCRCDCGQEVVTTSNRLRTGNKVSCGCAWYSRGGKSVTRRHEYGVWSAMKRRCAVPSDRAWKHYGGRGIRVCERWLNSFDAFYEDMGPRGGDRKQSTIDRINNDGNYEPGNCRWATMIQQGNNKRTCRYIEHAGRRQTVAEWAREAGVAPNVFAQRLAVGMSMDRALTKPLPKTKHLVLPNGGTVSQSARAREWGCSPGVIHARLAAGWTVEEAFAKPPRPHRDRKVA